MFYKEYPKSRYYNLREEGMIITYLLEYFYLWEKGPNVKYTELNSNITKGAPGMYFHEVKSQNIIRGIDVGVTKNGVETIAKIRQIEAQEDKKSESWRIGSKLLDTEITVACRPERLYETGISNLIRDIQNAKNITIYGFAGDTFFDSYNNVQISYVDDMAIDLGAGNVLRRGKQILTIPRPQVYAVADVLKDLRAAAIYGSIMR